MVKSRVAQQLKDVFLSGKSSSTNKSADFDFLSSQFMLLKVKIGDLIEALKAQHDSLLRMHQTRVLVSVCGCARFLNFFSRTVFLTISTLSFDM